MGLLFKAQTEKWPNGLAHLVVKELFKKYRLCDMISHVKLRSQLNKVSMKAQDDPSMLFEQISKIQNRFKEDAAGNPIKLEKEDLISIVLAVAPKEYQSVLMIEQRVKGMAIELDDLESAMVQHYRMTMNNKTKKEVAEGFETNFAATDQENKKNNQNGQSYKGNNKKKKSSCFICGKDGHLVQECWDNPSNASTRPKWYKPKKKEGNNGNEVNAVLIAKKNEDYEVIFCIMSQAFPDTLALLSNPNIWIADSLATADMTPYQKGMYDIQEADATDKAKCASGKMLDATKVGKLKGMLCNNQGKEVKGLTLLHVVLTPKGPYNVLSLTKRLMEG
jgi:hypothetical protein